MFRENSKVVLKTLRAPKNMVQKLLLLRTYCQSNNCLDDHLPGTLQYHQNKLKIQCQLILVSTATSIVTGKTPTEVDNIFV
jgi:hypothetical protein